VPELIPFLAMAGFAGVRRSELVREYAEDQVLKWEDVDWQKQLINVRHEVAKQSSRKMGNRRFIPMDFGAVDRANYTCPDTDAWDFSNVGVYLNDVATVAAFAAKNHRQSARSTVNALGWPVNFLCKESENGSTNRSTTLVI
jgi:hypothetical protein